MGWRGGELRLPLLLKSAEFEPSSQTTAGCWVVKRSGLWCSGHAHSVDLGFGGETGGVHGPRLPAVSSVMATLARACRSAEGSPARGRRSTALRSFLRLPEALS